MELWKWAYWLIGTLGVVGTIALFAFFPAIFSVALRAVVQFFTLVLSYRIGCAVAAALLAAFVADYHRHSKDDAEFARRTAAFEAAQDARDKQIAQATREAVWLEIANETAANTVVEKDEKEFNDALAPLPAGDNICRVGADVGRLRRIAGQAVGEPASPKRVPAPRRSRQAP